MGAYILVVVVTVLGGFVVYVLRGVRDERNAAYRHLVGHYPGATMTEAQLGEPLGAARIPVGDIVVGVSDTMERSGKSSSPRTTVRFELGALNPLGMRFTLYPEDFNANLFKLLGLPDVQLGIPGFDELFMIEATHEEAVRQFLDKDVRTLLTQLRQVGGVRRLYLRLDYHALDVMMASHLPAQQLVLFFDLARRLWPHVAAFLTARLPESLPADAGQAPEPGDLQVPPSAAGPGDAPSCRVCGKRIDGEVVRCVECGTSHHRECWDYNGRCSTIGCRVTGTWPRS